MALILSGGQWVSSVYLPITTANRSHKSEGFSPGRVRPGPLLSRQRHGDAVCATDREPGGEREGHYNGRDSLSYI